MSLLLRALLCTMGLANTACAAVPAPNECRVLRLHGNRAGAVSCFEALTRMGDAYLKAEGYWGLEQWDKANESFRAATSGPGVKALYQVRYGMLLHERFNNAEAVDLFREALKADPNDALAYVGLAQVSSDGFDGKAAEYVAKAIALDPKLVEAHELAADLALEDAKPDLAAKEADAAITLGPYGAGSDSLQALATKAAIDLLADRTANADNWMTKIRAVNPAYGEGYALIAKHLVLNRRYTEGVTYYRKAIEADPHLWSARAQLGINLMRLGQEDEPRKQLELCYNNGFRDAATVNSLRLLDSYKNFVTTRDDTTILRLRTTEADLLRPYFEEQLHKAIATYTARYKVKLDGPVQLEVYPDHEDFAVRTMGMPGLGALGVTFGEVVAMDSPTGRKPGDFNWGATLWHELSHVFILTATNHRVPRWFTEGLAVHEEGQTNPEWANRLTPEVVVAIRDKRLLPIVQIDRGFIFPEYPEQVIVSYWQAGTVCDYIQERWGADALLAMVHAFADRTTTAEAIQTDLHVTPEDFDKQYAAWVDRRVGGTVANFDAWRGKLKALVALSSTGKPDEVIAEAQAVTKLYPGYVGDANAYEYLAAAHIAKGDTKAAVDALSRYVTMGGQNPETLKKLSEYQAKLGYMKAAAATLDRLNFIYPEDEAMHRHLGGLLLAQGDSAGAVREYNAVLAMKPLDKAAAEYDAAKAYMSAGDMAKAEESVLASLEVAPGFRPAQTLLLEIESGASKEENKKGYKTPNPN
ncbi:MAG: hypothetical protein NVSMB62_21360 [Acidobacteriaceae bacterium]